MQTFIQVHLAAHFPVATQAIVFNEPGAINVQRAAVVGAAIKCLVAGASYAHKTDEKQGVMVFVGPHLIEALAGAPGVGNYYFLSISTISPKTAYPAVFLVFQTRGLPWKHQWIRCRCFHSKKLV